MEETCVLNSSRLYGNFEEALDVGFDVDGGEGAAVAAEGLPLRPNKELLEVPGHIAAAHWAPNDELGISHEREWVIVRVGKLVLQVGEDRMLVLTVHLTLLDKGEGGLEATPRADVLETVQDLLILTVLLMSKLVARKAKNHQAPGIAALQLVELGEVSSGCASERCYIFNQHCSASECIEIYFLPIQADSLQVVE